MNNINLIGALVNEPEVFVGRDGREGCAIEIAVQRRGPTGDAEPGVIYVDVRVHGEQAEEALQMHRGERIGIAGRLERDDSLDAGGPRRSRWEVYAHQLDFLDYPPGANG